MRKIGITLWLVAIILAAGLSATLLRTNLLAGPQARAGDPVSNRNIGSPTPPAKGPAPASASPPAAAPTVPSTSPAGTLPPTAAGSDELYQALQRIAQQLMGPDASGQGGASGFLAWYQQLEAASGQPMPADVAYAWFRHVLSDRVHGEHATGTDALTCGAGTFLQTCAGDPGSQG
jgi:hypothetical protein